MAVRTLVDKRKKNGSPGPLACATGGRCQVTPLTPIPDVLWEA